jgi:cytoskeletal protein CcmA (bactofilin family)
MARAGRSDAARGEAVIGRSTRVRGRVSGDGDLLLEGTVEGDISVRGDLVIGDSARAASSVEANAVTIRGELEGDVKARGVVRIEAGARVRGDVHGESFSLEEGAEFAGRLDAEFDLPAELSGGTSGGRRR